MFDDAANEIYIYNNENLWAEYNYSHCYWLLRCSVYTKTKLLEKSMVSWQMMEEYWEVNQLLATHSVTPLVQCTSQLEHIMQQMGEQTMYFFMVLQPKSIKPGNNPYWKVPEELLQVHTAEWWINYKNYSLKIPRVPSESKIQAVKKDFQELLNTVLGIWHVFTTQTLQMNLELNLPCNDGQESRN